MGLSRLRLVRKARHYGAHGGRFLRLLDCDLPVGPLAANLGGPINAKLADVSWFSAGRLEIPRTVPVDRDQAGYRDNEGIVPRGGTGEARRARPGRRRASPKVHRGLLPRRKERPENF